MPVEIVSVDSALVYRGMDIGTAKPSTRRARACAAPPDRPARPRATLLRRAVRGRRRRAHVATSARAAACRCWWAARCCTSRRCSKESTRCRRRTRRSARRSMPRPPSGGGPHCTPSCRAWIRSRRRACRPVTRSASSARSRSSAPRAGRCRASTAARCASRPLPRPSIALEPASRAWLHERIAQRFDAMLAARLLDEVRALRARGDLHPPAVDALRGLPPGLGRHSTRATCTPPARNAASPRRASSPSAS